MKPKMRQPNPDIMLHEANGGHERKEQKFMSPTRHEVNYIANLVY